MSEKINKKISHQIIFGVDILMIILVVFDLLLIAFDSIFSISILRQYLFMELLPDFSEWYASEIHHSFLLYESTFFTSIFIVELSIRWILAIWHKTYDKWFFYPIFHWYDVLGCIPLSSFRILRFIRVFVLLYKLHRWKIIDLNDYSIYRLIIHYYNIIVEEVSDRVAVNLLEDAKEQIRLGKPLGETILNDVVKPQQEDLILWASCNIRSGLRKHYNNNKAEIQNYFKHIIEESVKSNNEISNLEKIPFFGNAVTESINKAVSGISFGVIDKISSDLISDNENAILDTLVVTTADILLNNSDDLNNMRFRKLSNSILENSINVIISRVKEKKWKRLEAQMKEDDNDIFY